MLKAFVEKILDLAEPKPVPGKDGVEYTNKQLYVVRPKADAPLLVGSLGSIAEMQETIINNPDTVVSRTYVIVAREDLVVMGAYVGNSIVMHDHLMRVEADDRDYNDNIGKYMMPPEFIAWVTRSFYPSEVLDSIITVVSRLKDESEVKQVDDGLSQTVTVRAGVASMAMQKLPSTIKLTPMVSFFDDLKTVAAGQYFLRLKKEDKVGITCAMFEKHPNTRRRANINAIKKYLAKALGVKNVLS